MADPENPKVVNLHGQNADPRQASARVVEILEDLLEAAKAGEITGIAAATMYFDGSCGRSKGGMYNDRLVGTLHRLSHEILSF